ncbi:MAG: hypothetical protein EOM53_05405 [Alphaproteobacteria bacterium]|nr:hypothetical protein [Alphaproteobacteria bacterium]NCB50090.1 hypothetical protein [Alphaproteobacteria bacterium]
MKNLSQEEFLKKMSKEEKKVIKKTGNSPDLEDVMDRYLGRISNLSTSYEVRARNVVNSFLFIRVGFLLTQEELKEINIYKISTQEKPIYDFIKDNPYIQKMNEEVDKYLSRAFPSLRLQKNLRAEDLDEREDDFSSKRRHLFYELSMLRDKYFKDIVTDKSLQKGTEAFSFGKEETSDQKDFLKARIFENDRYQR